MPKKKTKSQKKLFDSDDDEKFDLKAETVGNEQASPAPKKKVDKKAEKKSKEVHDDDEEEIKPASKKKAEKKVKEIVQDESDEEEVQVKSKKKPEKNAFELLNTEEEEDEEEKEVKVKKNKRKAGKKSEPEPEQPEDEEDDEAEEEAENLNLSSLSLAEKRKAKKEKKNKKKEQEKEEQKAEPVAQPLFMDADEPMADNQFHKQTDYLTATGLLLSHQRSKDVQLDKFSLAAYGQQLIKDTSLNILYGKKYGLVGANGVGKSTLLQCLAHGHVPIQQGLSMYLLEREYEATEYTATEAVLNIVREEKEALEEEMNQLLETVEGADSQRMDMIQERLNELDLGFLEQKARHVLHGLGFTSEMQDMKTKEFSGGWRMRVALARALFVQPHILLLDDATNHLDLNAVVWLEDYLLHYPHTIVMVSHSQDLLNSVCTDILFVCNRKLEHFSGNYDTFTKVRAELEESARKRVKQEEKKKKKLIEQLGKTGNTKSAKNQEKAIQKRREKDGKEKQLEDDLEMVQQHKKLSIDFMQCGGGLPSPFLKCNNVSFQYPNRPLLYRELNFGLDLKSRVALVGANGAGKSTLMKLMSGELEPTEGEVYRHHHLKIARFHQHLTEQLDMDMTPVTFLAHQFQLKPQEVRNKLGRFGLTGKSQVQPMHELSDGQLRRVVFALLSLQNCHLLMLDEPTNFLDPETIDALAEGLLNFDGGVVLISHDFRMIDAVAEEIWVVDDGRVDVWEGDIREYKEYLKEKMKTEE